MPFTCSAGNLFGTTRTSQPGAVRVAAVRRYDSTSRGVICSWPSQKGQNDARRTAGCSRRKSLGRLRRSVEMITQRPVTGSFLSSGIGIRGARAHRRAADMTCRQYSMAGRRRALPDDSRARLKPGTTRDFRRPTRHYANAAANSGRAIFQASVQRRGACSGNRAWRRHSTARWENPGRSRLRRIAAPGVRNC